jgi:hypothetical protein
MIHRCLPFLLLLACDPGDRLGPVPEPTATRPEPAPVEVTGWEGFWSWDVTDQAWLEERSLPFTARPIHQAHGRVAKLVIAGGTMEAPEPELLQRWARSCEDPHVRSWNVDRCRGLERRSCTDGRCTYEHFGNCSGILAGDGWFVTAAHCTAGLEADAALAQASSILVPGLGGRNPSVLRPLSFAAGKRDWEHDWVALDDEDPVDVAAIRVGDGGLQPYPWGPLPAVGEPLYIMGYPRVEGRSSEALAAAGYELVAGTPSVSFGRMADTNPADAPLCNVDGEQEHWALRSPCPAGPVGEGDQQTWTGPISNSPFLASYDSCNGYSGAPVFDAAGRWVGVNFTLASDTDPQEAFVDHARMVATPVQRALIRLGIGRAE